MSIDNTTRIDKSAGAGLDADLAELRVRLARLSFPATQFDTLALLVARRAPSRLLWRVAALSRTRTYRSIDEVCAAITGFAGGRMPPPPGR